MEQNNITFPQSPMPIAGMEAMMEHMPVGFFVYRADKEEKFLVVNAAAVSLMGCDTKEEFLEWTGGSFRGFVAAEDVERVEASISSQILDSTNGTDAVEYRIHRKDGSLYWVKDYGRLINTPDEGQVFYVFVYDDTQRHRQEQQLAEQLHQAKNIAGFQPFRSAHPLSPKDGKKKTILIVEDSKINREILRELLQDEFYLLMAENGAEGIRLLKAHRNKLSLVLLDVYMPVCNGFQFLEKVHHDPFLSSVPVIVTTGSSNHEDEERCIQLGATDFLTKPYNPEIMLWRIRNVIRLHESLSELSIVEFDKVTGLYTMGAFLHHTEQLLAESEEEYDLGILNIPDYSSINRMYGEKQSREILRHVAALSKRLLPDALLARQGNDFYALRLSQNRDESFSETEHGIHIKIADNLPYIRMRQGLYQKVDKTQSASVLCDRVKMTVDSIEGKQGVSIAYYDASMEKRKLQEQKLLLAFDTAIENHEFVVWIQPKVDILSGQIDAGEALVRWIDGAGNFISPGAFIPLFEREGQIQQLDEYIFRTVCAYQRKQRQAGKRVVPISINLSRNSLFREGIVDIYRQIAQEEETALELVPIEITESAATTEQQIKGICEAFVGAGFLLQMDDFGAGYSSLSALAALPFHAVKLDKSLIDQIGTEKGNIVIKNAIETAHELGMRVVAEGVEERYQVEYLALVECDRIQGYFYSPPKKTDFFEELLAKDEPFAEKGRIQDFHGDGVVRMSTSELNRYLKICRTIFAKVRLLDTDLSESFVESVAGGMKQRHHSCFGIWNRPNRCKNCPSLRAMQSQKTEHKFEIFQNEVYSIYSVYMEVDGTPHILELINTVGGSRIEGLGENPSFWELVSAGGCSCEIQGVK